MFKLTDNQQAILMVLAVILVPLTLWLGSPDPLFSESSLRILFAGIAAGFIVFIKEIAAYKPRQP